MFNKTMSQIHALDCNQILPKEGFGCNLALASKNLGFWVIFSSCNIFFVKVFLSVCNKNLLVNRKYSLFAHGT